MNRRRKSSLRSSAALLTLSAAIALHGQGATIGPQAVKYVLTHFNVNGEATDPNTHRPLQMDGHWSLAKERPASCPGTSRPCLEIIYSEPAQSAKCSWIVTLNEDGSDGTVLDENDDAAKYMLPVLDAKHGKPFVKLRHKPVFPPLAAVLGARGPVTLWALVSPSGEVTKVSMTSGPATVQAASAEAAKKWKFKPMTIGARAVPYEVQLVFTFLPMTPTTGYVQVEP